MKQYITSLAVALMAFLSVNASAKAFECSVSKNYGEEMLSITCEAEMDDCISVLFSSGIFSHAFSGVTPDVITTTEIQSSISA